MRKKKNFNVVPSWKVTLVLLYPFSCYHNYKIKIKIWLSLFYFFVIHFAQDESSKSSNIYIVCRTRVTLKKDGVVLDLVPPPTKVNNLIFGSTWVDSPGEMIMTNLTTGDKVVLYFQPCGWFGYSTYLWILFLLELLNKYCEFEYWAF